MANLQKRLFIIAGEASGDMHAAKLIDEMFVRDPSVTFEGVGGANMRASGANILIDSAQLSVVGLVELLPHLWTIYQALQMVKQHLERHPPDLLILIDFSGFNLKVAKKAKQLGIKILYYISPQVWAWRSKRVELIRKYVDRMAVIYPFEFDFYQKAKIPVSLIRHPLLDQMTVITSQEARLQLNLAANKKTVGLLPGSRRSEIKYLLPILLATAQQLYRELPDLQFVLPLASTIKQEDINQYIVDITFPLRLVTQQTQTVLQSCDVVIATSGTVTLEAALQNIPMIIVYRLSSITFAIIRHLVKLPYIGLCNIVAEKKIVKEFIQQNANPKMMGDEIKRILFDEAYSQDLQQQLNAVREKLETSQQTCHIADVVVEMLE